jgi:hypothetical protein
VEWWDIAKRFEVNADTRFHDTGTRKRMMRKMRMMRKRTMMSMTRMTTRRMIDQEV